MTGTIRSRVPMEEYRAISALSFGRLKELKHSPLHYRYRLGHPLEKPPLVLGTAAHCATLEPERFEKQFAIWTQRTSSGRMSPRSGKWWDAFVAANEGKQFLTDDEAQTALSIAVAVRNDPVAMKYLATGEPEVTLQWEAHGRPCKARPDWMTRLDGEPVLVGLKTARDVRPYQFSRQVATLGYHIQMAWYFNGYSIIRDGERPRQVEITVESEPPHAVVVYTVPDDVLLRGEEEYLQLIELLDECERLDRWPGPATEEQELTLPAWAYPSTGDDITALGLEA